MPEDFPTLLRLIADLHHGGRLQPIAYAMPVASAVVHLWVSGRAKPRRAEAERLHELYGLGGPELLSEDDP